MLENEVINLLTEYREYAIAISILLSIIIAVLGIVPSIFLTTANVAAFGVFYGMIISWVGEVIGAVISFCLFRLGFKQKINQKYSKSKILKQIVDAKGVKAGILIFEGRIIPFLPSGVVTFISSISQVNLRIFLVATALGKIPSLALETLISIGIINVSRANLNIILTFACLILSVITYKLLSNRNKKN